MSLVKCKEGVGSIPPLSHSTNSEIKNSVWVSSEYHQASAMYVGINVVAVEWKMYWYMYANCQVVNISIQTHSFISQS